MGVGDIVADAGHLPLLVVRAEAVQIAVVDVDPAAVVADADLVASGGVVDDGEVGPGALGITHLLLLGTRIAG